MKRLALLFWEFFRISLCVIGGGYAIVAVADGISSRRKWTKEGELLDALPVFQMIPGLMSTHAAAYVGRKVAGIGGAAVAVLATIIPPIAVFLCIAVSYERLPLTNPLVAGVTVGLRAALTGLIAAAFVRSWRKAQRNRMFYAVFACAAVALSMHVPIWCVLLAAFAVGLAAVSMSDESDNGMSGEKTKTFRSSAFAFLLFLKYGALALGGGYVLVPMYLEDFVGPAAPFLQMTAEEFANVMALTQMTPGPIGINGATFFGYRLAGVPGSLLASLALLLPGTLLAYLAFASLDRFRTSRVVRGWLRGARPAALALLLVALAAFCECAVLANGSFDTLAAALVVISFILIGKKKMNPIAVILIVAATAGAVRADTENYPDADAVLVDDLTRITYRPDGTYEQHGESWTKVLTEKGRRDESTVSLDYSKRYGKASIDSIGIIGTNGVERTVDVSATMREATDNGSMGMNIYDPLDRRIVCTIPGLKIGEIVHLKTTRIALKPRCEGIWSDLEILEWSCPIVRARVEIRAPKERPLNKIKVAHPLGNVTESHTTLADGGMLHVYCCTNSPQAFPEPDMPPLYTQIQNLRVSTASDWREVSRWYWNLCAPHLAKTNAALVAKVNDLVGAASGSRDTALRSIFKFVSQEVRYMGLTMEDASPGYAPHDVSITFDNRYGVCRDKAGLLVAMLRLAGFEAYPVLIHVGARHDPSVPQPFFNHAIVAVVTPSSSIDSASPYLLLDPTNENAKDLFPAYESNRSYLVARPDGDDLRTSPTPSPEHNALKIVAKGVLSRDGSLIVDHDIFFGGVNDTIYRAALVRMTGEERTKFFERQVRKHAAGAELLRCEVTPTDLRDTDTPMSVKITSRLPEMLLEGDTRLQLSVPFLSRTMGMANFLLAGNTSLERRRFPLQLESTGCVDEQVEIDLAGCVGSIRELPERMNLDGGYDYRREFAVSNGILTAHRRLAVSKVEFSPSEYGDLREAIKRVEAAERKRPVFDVDENADANVRVVDHETDVSVLSDSAWMVTNRIVKEILTYQGKKSAAELKLSYNPIVEARPIVTAVVSNRDGRVIALADRERNVMDCGWAAAAPRYPASKILVASLPSVEIGSVIAITVVRTVTNAPAPYYGSFGFDSHEPLAHRRVRVNGWSREVTNPRRIPDEPGQPSSSLWRDQVVISSNRFAAIDLKLVDNLDVPKDLGEELSKNSGLISVRAIRDWMAKQVKICGPSLYEIPLENQLTSPDVVLRERYATRLDYMRTLCSLLRTAGFDASVVFSACNASEPDELRKRDKFTHPNLRAFGRALCRVSVKDGGFLGLCSDETAYFIGTESQYAPLGPTSDADSDYFDPETCEFGLVTVPKREYGDRAEEESTYLVRENGTVDLTLVNTIYGSGVGGFRKRYAEILPEEHSRRYQAILGGIAQAASATSELETDVDGYPATRKFSCIIPDYATVDGDTLTLQLPPLVSSIPTFVGRARQTPFAVSATDAESETVTVRFPEGYDAIEHLPESFSFGHPNATNEVWLTQKVSTQKVDGALEVKIVRTVFQRAASHYAADMIELIKDRSRIASSRANRTIVVRRAR